MYEGFLRPTPQVVASVFFIEDACTRLDTTFERQCTKAPWDFYSSVHVVMKTNIFYSSPLLWTALHSKCIKVSIPSANTAQLLTKD